MKEKAQNVLRYLGGTANYRGYQQTVVACQLVQADETLLLCVTRELYPKVAEKFGCNADNVERNIRTLIKHIWNRHPERLSEISHCDLQYPPTSAEFLDYLVTYIQRELMVKP